MFFGVLFGRGVVVMCLLCFCRYVSALFYVYAYEYCFCFDLYVCLYVSLCMLVYAGCEGAGSFAGARCSLAAIDKDGWQV